MEPKALGCALTAFLLPAIGAVAAPQETFCLAALAWACEAPGGIEDIERMEAMERGNGQGHYSKELDDLLNKGQCGVAAAEPYRITVMHADDKFAFFCEGNQWRDIHAPDKERKDFYCRYALISDVRDAAGQSISRERLVAASKKTTMWDVADFAFCKQPIR